MIYFRDKAKGFSLIEVLLVMAIMATIMMSVISYTTQKSEEMRRSRTIVQMEQILNAGLAYYVSFGSWPAALANLQGSFLPNGTIVSGWGQTFTVGATSASGSQFSACTTIVGKQSFAAATTIAGRLPFALALDGAVSCPTVSTTPVCTKTSTSCTVVSYVTIPGQNLNNARSINFAGLYHSGACVAAPSCPANMVPTIFLTPVSLSGMNDDATKVYPIASFSTYARGVDLSASPQPGASPYDCDGSTPTTCSLPNTAKYWRACVRIVTDKGLVSGSRSTFSIPGWFSITTTTGNPDWARDAAVILALTRCMPANEPSVPSVSGSGFNVFEIH